MSLTFRAWRDAVSRFLAIPTKDGLSGHHDTKLKANRPANFIATPNALLEKVVPNAFGLIEREYNNQLCEVEACRRNATASRREVVCVLQPPAQTLLSGRVL